MTSPDWQAVRSQFPTLRRKNYLNTCSLGLLSEQARAAVIRYLDQWEEKGAAAWYAGWLGAMDDLRSQFALLINARPTEIAILPSISAALAAVSSSLDLGSGDEVVTTGLDFPTVAHHFHAKARTGVVTRIVPSEDRVTVHPERIGARMSDRTRLVATSRVFFTSGHIQDIEAITEIAHRGSALAFVDDYQATGQVPIDVKRSDIDILVSGGLKWLLGGPGIAYMYVREELVQDLEPTVAGWFGDRDQFAFNPHEMVFKDTAARFETGTPSVAAIYTGTAGLQHVNELGADAIRARTSALTNQLVALLRERGFKLRVPEDGARHASITMIEEDDPAALVRLLAERNIIVDHRPGAVRVSPYFYNNSEDIVDFVDALCDARDRLR